MENIDSVHPQSLSQAHSWWTSVRQYSLRNALRKDQVSIDPSTVRAIQRVNGEYVIQFEENGVLNEITTSTLPASLENVPVTDMTLGVLWKEKARTYLPWSITTSLVIAEIVGALSLIAIWPMMKANPASGPHIAIVLGIIAFPFVVVLAHSALALKWVKLQQIRHSVIVESFASLVALAILARCVAHLVSPR